MKKSYLILSFSAVLALITDSCSKSGYASTDETTGIVNTTKLWSGYSTGYLMGDTILTPGSASVPYARYYYHIITDSSITVQKVNDLQIKIMDMPLNYASTDATTHLVLFDSTISGSAPSKLDYYSNTGSMTYEYHWVGTYNAASGHYYQTDIYMHTN